MRRRCGTRTSTRRMPAAISATSTRRTTSNGIAAGLSTKTEQDRLRRRQADPLGAAQHQLVRCSAPGRSNPNATVQLIFTGDWSLPVREAEATNALVDAGCDVITCHVDSPKVVIETAERPRRQDLRPQRLAGPAGAQGLHHRRRVQVGDDLQGLRRRARQGRDAAELRRGGYDKDMVQNTAFGAGASDAAQARPRLPRSPSSRPSKSDLRGPAEGQQGQGRDPGDKTYRQLRPRRSNR